jgi:hypothetical protein
MSEVRNEWFQRIRVHIDYLAYFPGQIIQAYVVAIVHRRDGG